MLRRLDEPEKHAKTHKQASNLTDEVITPLVMCPTCVTGTNITPPIYWLGALTNEIHSERLLAS